MDTTPADPLSDPLRHLGPNWFASVMGTGIVANAAVLLPVEVPGLRQLAAGMWVLAALLLVVLAAATVVHWRRHPSVARGHASDPAMAPFYGAPAMALMTVGAGSLLVGRDLIGAPLALGLDLALWSAGTVGGLFAAALVPYLMFTRHELRPDTTFATWLMPVVPPMVSAATGAALVAHLPAGQAQLTLLVACYAMFGLSLVASLVTITLVWARLAYHAAGPAHNVPTLWIVLGPLGQSITAAGLLARAAPGVIAEPYATGMRMMGVLYGAPIWGFAMLWLAIAAAITFRTARGHLPFTLTWWSFTFPVGTCVTGTSALAAATGADALGAAAAVLFGLLLLGWAVAALNTARGLTAGRRRRRRCASSGRPEGSLRVVAADAA